MKNLDIHEDILEDGKLSESKLNDLLQDYQVEVQQVAKEVLSYGLTGDALSDEFFNNVDGFNVLSFEIDGKTIELSLNRFYSYDEKPEFGACYCIEVISPEFEMLQGFTFDIGEENFLISQLKKLGYEE